MGLGAQHHSSTPRSPFGFAWALQHRPRALCWQDEDASNGLSSFPSPSLVAMPARRATRERGGLKCLQETVRAVLLGGGAQRRLLPAVHVAGSAGLPPALPLPRSKRETSLGLHPWGTAGEKGEKCWGSLLLPPPDPTGSCWGLSASPCGAVVVELAVPRFQPRGSVPSCPPKTVLPRGWQVACPQPGTPSSEEGISCPQSPADKEGTVVLGAVAAPPPRHAGRQLVLEENGG